jgi:hypothetical protein
MQHLIRLSQINFDESSVPYLEYERIKFEIFEKTPPLFVFERSNNSKMEILNCHAYLKFLKEEIQKFHPYSDKVSNDDIIVIGVVIHSN